MAGMGRKQTRSQRLEWVESLPKPLRSAMGGKMTFALPLVEQIPARMEKCEIRRWTVGVRRAGEQNGEDPRSDCTISIVACQLAPD